MSTIFLLFLFPVVAAWVGHAYLWTSLLNYVYARPYPKKILKFWRLATGIAVLGFPLPALMAFEALVPGQGWTPFARDEWNATALVYSLLCLLTGAGLYPGIAAYRHFRKPPKSLLAETTHTIDLWKELGDEAIGNGKGVAMAKLPFNCIYRVDFTELTLAIPELPTAWDGLTILLVSDVHYHGTPSREFHDRAIGEIESRWPVSDLVCLAGDYVDTDEHQAWIGPLLGRLQATEGKFAILGNHDLNHHPERVRAALEAAGYRAVGNGWHETTIRGERCVVVGHEGPWVAPPPDLSAAPRDGFRLCLSHTPDNFYWGLRSGIRLMLCGHVHGGQIRLPFITSMFVPSVYGRRFDMGVFEEDGGVMVVGRGLSGQEPLRFRCHPQVIRIKLTRQ